MTSGDVVHSVPLSFCKAVMHDNLLGRINLRKMNTSTIEVVILLVAFGFMEATWCFLHENSCMVMIQESTFVDASAQGHPQNTLNGSVSSSTRTHLLNNCARKQSNTSVLSLLLSPLHLSLRLLNCCQFWILCHCCCPCGSPHLCSHLCCDLHCCLHNHCFHCSDCHLRMTQKSVHVQETIVGCVCAHVFFLVWSVGCCC